MLSLSHESIAGGHDSRCSVLDTLLLRPTSEGVGVDSLSRRYSYGSLTPYVSSDASSTERRGSLLVETLSPNGCPETRTPTTRVEQLELLLARNYYSAPACSLDFVNLTSSIRDSCETVPDLGPAIDKIVPERFESSSPSPTKDCMKTVVPGIGLDSSGLDHSHYGPPLTGSVLRSITNSTSSGDVSESDESPSVFCEEAVPAASALLDMHNASEAIRAGSKSHHHHMVHKMPKAGRLIYSNSVDISTSPLSQYTDEDASSLQQSLSCGVDASTSPMESAKKSIPVYSRSLLYRIRVPLAQRLRNACTNFGEGHGSANRLNLSCERRSLDLQVNMIESTPGDSSSGDSSAGEGELDWSTDALESNGVDTAHSNGPEGAEYMHFLKRRRLMVSGRCHKKRKKSDGSPNEGLMLLDEFWPRGTMKSIGPCFDDPTICNGGKLPQLNRLLANHFYLCTGSHL